MPYLAVLLYLLETWPKVSYIKYIWSSTFYRAVAGINACDAVVHMVVVRVQFIAVQGDGKVGMLM